MRKNRFLFFLIFAVVLIFCVLLFLSFRFNILEKIQSNLGKKSQETLFSQPENTSIQSSKGSSQEPLIVYGYMPYWTRNKAVFAQPVTHVSYFSLGIQSDGKLLNIPKLAQETGYRSYQNGVLRSIRQEMQSDQKLELTLTMMNQDAIPLFLNNSEAQDQFLTDLRTIITTSPISGINIDIEYNGVVDSDLQNKLVTLLHRTKVLLKQQSPPLSLSIATYSDAGNLQRLTHLASIAPEVDHIIMMAYDYYRSNSPSAGPNSPLYGKSKNRWSDDIMSDLKEYTDVMPAQKILLGIPLYGYSWSIEDRSNPNSFTLPRSGQSVMYSNIVPLLSQPGINRQWDADAMSPFIVYTSNGKTKVLYYDDAVSIRYKTQLVRDAGLGGVALWAVGYEGEHQDLLRVLAN